MVKIDKNYYVKSLEIIDCVLKGVHVGNDMQTEEFLMWYYFIKLLGKENYNTLMEEKSFENFHKIFQTVEIEMDLFRAPMCESTMTSISSEDTSSYDERKMYRRNIEIDESPKIQGLIYNFIRISKVPEYVWKQVKKRF